MGRQVPAVERALDVLELLADHPDEALGLSEIARRLDLNKASCHAIVTLLGDRGYLLRRAGKTYSLGPSILPLAKTFLTEHDALPRARAEMTALSRELGLDSVASAVVDDEIVVLAIANSPASMGVHVRAGSRFALVPPVGTVFLAWAGPEGIARWLARVAPSANAREHERYTQALTRVRERGYAVGFGRARPRSADGADLLRDFEEYVLVEMEAAQNFPIMNLAAPIIDPEGNVAMAISLVGFYEQMQAADIPRLGRRLRAATAAVSRATWGTSDPSAPSSGLRPEATATRGALRPRASRAATSDLERLRAQRTH